MIRPILKWGAPELEKNCSPVDSFDEELRNTVQDMLETMYDAPGVGLAAPQVGLDQRLIVIDLTGGKEKGHQLVLANPEIVHEEGVQREEEGCLSIPDFTAVVERPYRVRVVGQDVNGREIEVFGEALLARALAHEIDHINGILYLERISPFRREMIKRKIRKLMKAGDW